MNSSQGHTEKDAFTVALTTLQTLSHSRSIDVIVADTSQTANHDPHPLSPFIISGQDGVKQRAGRDRRGADRQNESFTLLSSSSSLAFTRRCCTRLSSFLQLSPRVCPCFTSGTVCSNISWRGDWTRGSGRLF